MFIKLSSPLLLFKLLSESGALYVRAGNRGFVPLEPQFGHVQFSCVRFPTSFLSLDLFILAA